jgi:hypothetical protein
LIPRRISGRRTDNGLMGFYFIGKKDSILEVSRSIRYPMFFILTDIRIKEINGIKNIEVFFRL